MVVILRYIHDASTTEEEEAPRTAPRQRRSSNDFWDKSHWSTSRSPHPPSRPCGVGRMHLPSHHHSETQIFLNPSGHFTIMSHSPLPPLPPPDLNHGTIRGRWSRGKTQPQTLPPDTASPGTYGARHPRKILQTRSPWHPRVRTLSLVIQTSICWSGYLKPDAKRTKKPEAKKQRRKEEKEEAGSKEAKKKRSRKQKGQKGKSSTKKQTEKKGDTSDTDENTSDFLERARRKRREILATSSEEDHVRE